jgi:prevent-host-death family protein
VTDVPLRELRNNPSAVLRRVERGERLRVTIDRRPVAELVPLARRERWVPVERAWPALVAARADASLRDELRQELPETTDELWDDERSSTPPS